MQRAKAADPSVEQSMVRDLLVLELLRWFKEDFFSWFDFPSCDVCSDGGSVAKKGHDLLTREEQQDGATFVELCVVNSNCKLRECC